MVSHMHHERILDRFTGRNRPNESINIVKAKMCKKILPDSL